MNKNALTATYTIPLQGNDGTPFAPTVLDEIAIRASQDFGGCTLVRSDCQGVWHPAGPGFPCQSEPVALLIVSCMMTDNKPIPGPETRQLMLGQMRKFARYIRHLLSQDCVYMSVTDSHTELVGPPEHSN